MQGWEPLLGMQSPPLLPSAAPPPRTAHPWTGGVGGWRGGGAVSCRCPPLFLRPLPALTSVPASQPPHPARIPPPWPPARPTGKRRGGPPAWGSPSTATTPPAAASSPPTTRGGDNAGVGTGTGDNGRAWAGGRRRGPRSPSPAGTWYPMGGGHGPRDGDGDEDGGRGRGHAAFTAGCKGPGGFRGKTAGFWSRVWWWGCAGTPPLHPPHPSAGGTPGTGCVSVPSRAPAALVGGPRVMGPPTHPPRGPQWGSEKCHPRVGQAAGGGDTQGRRGRWGGGDSGAVGTAFVPPALAVSPTLDVSPRP